MSLIERYRRSDSRLVAGVMSGTSLDGIDVALVRVAGAGGAMRHELMAFYTEPYDAELRGRLLRASAGEMMLRETFELDADLGVLYAEAVLRALGAADVEPARLDAVGLHGQTVYHNPRRAPNGVTVQLGSGAAVARRTGALVVRDFRAADVAAGGEGAPLVPYCDLVLLAHPERNRVALNIGGIANITWLPVGVTADRVIAFDTGPGNMLIDAAMRELFGADVDYDGAVAARGRVDARLLDRLLADEYFDWPAPKSAGRERFGEDRGRAIARDAVRAGAVAPDVIATLTLLTARTIAGAVRMHAARGAEVHEIIVGGGGARNATLMRMLADEFPAARLMPADDVGLPADAKEAIAFAILANEALCEVPATLPSVTGAERPVIAGTILFP